MLIRSKAMRQCLFVCTSIILLSACAASKMFMPGYTPPMKIADLINQQQTLSDGMPEGAIGLNLQNGSSTMHRGGNNPINLESYKGNLAEKTPNYLNTVDAFAYQRPPRSFTPQYTHKSIQDYAGQLAMQLMKNANHLDEQAAIGVSSFVKLDHTLQNTNLLGNQLAEYAISEIQQFGVNVVDVKLMPAIEVTRNGDLAFSRDVKRLSKRKVMDHVVSGTMIERNDGVFINARIIALGSNRVVSSASVLVPYFVVEQSTPQFLGYGI